MTVGRVEKADVVRVAASLCLQAQAADPGPFLPHLATEVTLDPLMSPEQCSYSENSSQHGRA